MQTKEKLSTTITEMLSEVDDVRSLERIYHFIQCINAGSGNIVKEIYKGRIIEMVEEIEDQVILKRIYQLAEYLYIKQKS